MVDGQLLKYEVNISSVSQSVQEDVKYEEHLPKLDECAEKIDDTYLSNGEFKMTGATLIVLAVKHVEESLEATPNTMVLDKNSIVAIFKDVDLRFHEDNLRTSDFEVEETDAGVFRLTRHDCWLFGLSDTFRVFVVFILKQTIFCLSTFVQ